MVIKNIWEVFEFNKTPLMALESHNNVDTPRPRAALLMCLKRYSAIGNYEVLKSEEKKNGTLSKIGQ